MAAATTERTSRGRVPPPARGVKYWDVARGRWRYRPKSGKVVDLHSPEGERAYAEDRGRPRRFSGRAALRRSGALADRGAGRAAAGGQRLGGRLLEPTQAGAASLGELALYLFGTIIGLALLETALSGRGPAAVSRVLGVAGTGIDKLFSPTDPLVGKGTVPALPAGPAVGPVSESPAVAARTTGVQPEITAGLRPGQGLNPKAGGFLAKGALYKPGRSDQGRDFQTNPGGAILAPGDGRVVAVRSDPKGFGPSYPIVHFTTGLYAGMTLYVGHTLSALRPGQRFVAGQVLSHTGKRPIGNASKPGWAEIGYAPGGVPGKFGQPVPF